MILKELEERVASQREFKAALKIISELPKKYIKKRSKELSDLNVLINR